MYNTATVAIPNSVNFIGFSVFDGDSNLKIYGDENSYAQ